MHYNRAKPVKRLVYDYKNADFAGLRACLNHVPFNFGHKRMLGKLARSVFNIR